MSRFARIGEEVFARHAELTGEELRLYIIIVFHTWTDSGVCNKNLKEISDLYGLAYNHLTERYKKLRKIGWCLNTKKGICPLVGVKTPKFGVEKGAKLQNSEFETPKFGVEKGAKLQNSEFVYKEFKEPLKDEKFATAAEKKIAAAAAEKNKPKSQFSLEECLRYAEFCKNRGDHIYNPEGLANTAYQSGEYDAFIFAAIYPDGLDLNGNPVPKRLSGDQRDYYLKNLRSLSDEEFDPDYWREQFTAEDWAYLAGELRNEH